MGFNLKVWKFGKVWKSLEIPYLEKFGNGNGIYTISKLP
jgi:hypothetical protein